jgi:hypothetical protein
MSDLLETKSKTKEGADWRGDIRVSIDGDEQELVVRQLSDTEHLRVMSMINRDELQDYREALPEDLMDEYSELEEKDELTDDESERFEEITEELEEEGVDILEYLSLETFKGIQLCAKYCVEPDEDDLVALFKDREFCQEVSEEYGIDVNEPQDLRMPHTDDTDPVQDLVIDEMIEEATGMVSFRIGVRGLAETVGEEGNSKN